MAYATNYYKVHGVGLKIGEKQLKGKTRFWKSETLCLTMYDQLQLSQLTKDAPPVRHSLSSSSSPCSQLGPSRGSTVAP